ncbi:Retrovirus-related Pol polyprotein from transposon TNT 1-94-like protein [Drosera capensis]
MDMKTTFLHGYLEETIYMDQHERFIEPDKEGLVYRLKRSLYGLKQSPRQWYKRFDGFMMTHGYSRGEYDPCIYYLFCDDGFVLLVSLYVDNMLIAAKNKDILQLKKMLSKKFEMKDLDAAKKMLSMEISRDKETKKFLVDSIGLR